MHPSTALPRLILASSSRYRQELLSRLHLPFDTCTPDIDEAPLAHEAPETTAMRLAGEKAQAVAARFPAGALIIGSDQVATLDGRQIGKPGTHEKALAQLQMMRGRRVIFHTALCLLDSRQQAPLRIQVEDVQTSVMFRDVSDSELEAYLHIEQPYDVAGSAKNEGLGIAIIERIESTDPTALTGLPLITLCSMLRKAGVPFFSTPAS